MGLGTRTAMVGLGGTGAGAGAGTTVGSEAGSTAGAGSGAATTFGSGAGGGPGAGATVGAGGGATPDAGSEMRPVDDSPASRAPLAARGRTEDDGSDISPLIMEGPRLGPGDRTSGAEEDAAGEGALTGGAPSAERSLSMDGETTRGDGVSDPATDGPADAEAASEFSGFGSGVLSLSAI